MNSDQLPDDESGAIAAVQAAAIETRPLVPAVPSTRSALLIHRPSISFDGSPQGQARSLRVHGPGARGEVSGRATPGSATAITKPAAMLISRGLMGAIEATRLSFPVRAAISGS